MQRTSMGCNVVKGIIIEQNKLHFIIRFINNYKYILGFDNITVLMVNYCKHQKPYFANPTEIQ